MTSLKSLKFVSLLRGLKQSKGLQANYTTTVNTSSPQNLEKSINNVQLLGRVGADPQLKGNDAHPLVTFSLATHSNYKYESGDFLQRTEWHRVICFKPGLRDTILKYVKKGSRVLVNGRITYGEMTGEDGGKRPTTAITAEDVIFLNKSSVENN